MRSHASDFLDVRNPASTETMVRAPLSPLDEVNESFMHCQAAFTAWQCMTPVQRIQYLFTEVAG